MNSPVYVVIEMADIEILGVHCASSRLEADNIFDRIAQEIGGQEWEDLEIEAPDTVRLVGDDVCSVQMFAKVPKP